MEKIKQKINVPAGVRYISEWKGFELLPDPYILDKKIPGCGFTEFCITNGMNIILCSPRIVLLENKQQQHPDDVLFVRNSLDVSLNVDRDITKSNSPLSREVKTPTLTEEEKQKLLEENYQNLYQQVESYYYHCISHGKPCKLLVTYDSYRILQSILRKQGIFDRFYTVVDEFQSIFTDSRFKSDTEMEFIRCLESVNKNLCFVSATPMIDEYLDMLDEFKDLPYYELDWSAEDPLRVSSPELKVRTLKSVTSAAMEIIDSYKSGKFEEAVLEDGRVVQSKEAVIYVNSVNNLVSIIKKAKLLPEEVNILCAKTPENIKKIKKSLKMEIGTVPLKGEHHKMFTFCTRTVYLGADFYSTNAQSFILSDANITTLAVDITLDLPQILGRQRLNENPWKNRATLLFKTITSKNEKSKDMFEGELQRKIQTTKSLLRSYENAENRDKHNLAEKYERDAKSVNYKYDYVAVNKHSGKDLLPVFNNLVMVSERRAYDIQQIDYKDRFSVFNQVSKLIDNRVREVVINFLKVFNSLPDFRGKMKYLCEADLTEEQRSFILTQIPISYKNYYIKLGSTRLKSLGYNITYIKREYDDLLLEGTIDISERIYSIFTVGEKYTKAEIKEILKQVYNDLGINRTPKATDLLDYFDAKPGLVTNKATKKRDNCYEIIKKKGL